MTCAVKVKLSWDSMAAFGGPVVPDVYTRWQHWLMQTCFNLWSSSSSDSVLPFSSSSCQLRTPSWFGFPVYWIIAFKSGKLNYKMKINEQLFDSKCILYSCAFLATWEMKPKVPIFLKFQLNYLKIKQLEWPKTSKSNIIS